MYKMHFKSTVLTISFLCIAICLSFVIWWRHSRPVPFSSVSVKTIHLSQLWQQTRTNLTESAAEESLKGQPSPSLTMKIEIKPERLAPQLNSTDVYFSLLTAPKYHDSRFSLQYLTWLQTVDPHYVSFKTII